VEMLAEVSLALLVIRFSSVIDNPDPFNVRSNIWRCRREKAAVITLRIFVEGPP
jgi:hypothetical protein